MSNKIKKNVENENLKIIFFRGISIIIIYMCIFFLFIWQRDNSLNNNLQNNLLGLVSSEDTDIEIDETDSDSEVSETSENLNANSLITNSNIRKLSVDFNSLIQQNPDTVAWIKIDNTNISYPIVQSVDNNYYLKRNFNGEKNGAGWIFADCRNNFDNLDKNTIIYGHNRRNGTMFSNLNYYLSEDWYTDENNKYFNFATKNRNFIAEIFSVYKVSSKNLYLNNSFDSLEEVQENIDTWKEASIYDFKTDVSANDKFLTLYTCDNTNSNRIIIISKLIPIK